MRKWDKLLERSDGVAVIYHSMVEAQAEVDGRFEPACLMLAYACYANIEDLFLE